ncbi:MAG TPA: PD-(D/E)XK nuclease family protein [Acidimicrobiia bacterium]|nr:PD-(D/E)XK nuclease family protein [Acidimicrobiia bacterium]
MTIRFPEMVHGEALKVSASTYVTFKKCPAQAGARLQGIYGPESRHSFLGILAHRIFSRHLTSGSIPSDDFVQACREEIGGSSLNNKMADLEMRPSALAAVIDEVRGLYERFTRLPSEGFEGSEHNLEATVAEGVDLMGTVDAVYRDDLGGFRLVDWKTGELTDPEDQLLFYALLWLLDSGELPAYVEAVSVRTGERYRTVPSSADAGRVAAQVAELVDLLRNAWATGADLPRTGGPWCRYCPLLEDCEEGKSVGALLD